MSTPTSPASGPELSQSGARCPTCSAVLASDQRYCLRCGRRLGEPRVDFQHALGLRAPPPPPPARRTGWDQRAPLITLLGVAAILLALGVGIVLGRGQTPSTGTGRTTTTIVSVSGGAAAPTATAPSATAQNVASISEDWPAGASGWTVELSSLPKSSAQSSDVLAAKSAASGKGAKDVGALDGDKHGGTPTGTYVIYAGRFASAKLADAELAKLNKTFPGALVLHVTPKGTKAAGGSTSNASAALGSTQHLSGSAYVQASKKLPAQIGTGGTPPKKDNKTPGAGSSATCIGC
jgi:hypothetical protein